MNQRGDTFFCTTGWYLPLWHYILYVVWALVNCIIFFQHPRKLLQLLKVQVCPAQFLFKFESVPTSRVLVLVNVVIKANTIWGFFVINWANKVWQLLQIRSDIIKLTQFLKTCVFLNQIWFMFSSVFKMRYGVRYAKCGIITPYPAKHCWKLIKFDLSIQFF